MMNGDTKIIIDLINNRIDGVERQIERQIDKLDNKLTDKVHNHCGRIKMIEEWKNTTKGKMSLMYAIISGVVAFVVSVILIIIGKKI